MLSPCKESGRRFTCKEKGKKKMLEYDTGTEESHWSKSDSGWNEEGPSKTKSKPATKAIIPTNEKLHRSILQKNTVKRYEYNAYMVHHYAYMTKVAEVREPQSYAEATKDANWHVAMEEEMRALDANDTWDLVDPP